MPHKTTTKAKRPPVSRHLSPEALGHATARQGRWTKWEGHKHGEWKWDYPTNPFAPGSIQFRAFNMQRLGLVRS